MRNQYALNVATLAFQKLCKRTMTVKGVRESNCGAREFTRNGLKSLVRIVAPRTGLEPVTH